MTSACEPSRLAPPQDIAPATHSRPEHGIRATLFRTTPLLALSRACNLLFYVLLASRFGVTRQADGLFFTLALAGACGVIVGGAIEATLVPVCCRTGVLDTNRDAPLRPMFKLAAGLLAALVITALFADWIVGPLTGFDAAALSNVRILLLEMAPVQFFTLWNCMLRGRAYARGRFVAVAWASLAESLLLIAASALLAQTTSVLTVPLAMLVSSLAATAILLSTAGRPATHAPSRDQPLAGPTPETSGSRLLYAQVAGSGLASLNPLIDQMFASFLTVGAVSTYTYASRGFVIPVSGLLGGFLPIFLSVVSRSHHDLARVKKWISRCLLYTALGSCAVSLLFCLSGKRFVDLAFQRGIFQAGGVENLYPLCAVLYAGLPSYVLMILIGRIHISIMNARTIWMAATLSLALNILLDWVLGRALGLNGIGLASTLDYTAIALFLYWRLQRSEEWNPCRP